MFRCDCGVERVVVGQPLREGKTKSCGCLMGDAISKLKTKHGQSANLDRRSPSEVSAQAALNKRKLGSVTNQSTIGKSKYRQSITYKRWLSMKARVNSKRPEVFKYYGERGIVICERWKNSFESFLADMGECPKGLTLDRYPNLNGNYEPGNCRWATWSEQSANKNPRKKKQK